MQTAQAAVPYLQNPAAMKKDYVSTGNRSDQKSSFSDTLKQGLSKGNESAADNAVSTKPAQSSQKEPVQEDLAQQPQVEGVVIPIMPGVIQTPVVPQEAAAEAVLPVTDLTAAEIPVVPAEQQALDGGELTGITDVAESTADAFPKQAAAAGLQSASVNRQNQTGSEQKTNDTAAGAVQQSAESTVKTVEAQPNQAGQNMTQQRQNQAETETTDTRNSDVVQAANRQDTSISQTAAFEVPKTTQRASVDMTNLRDGIQNLARTMADHMQTGKNEFEIWLEPANLGKMAIKVAYESGRAMISIMCTNEKTMELISQNAKQLGSILQQHTGDETVVVIEHPESDYLQQKMDQEQQGGQQQEEKDNNKNNQQQDADHESFLQQLRLGLM